MSSQYAGDPDNFPDDYTIPDDSDPPTASAFNVAAEALGDRTAWLKSRLPYLESTTITTSGSAQTVEVPAGATHCFYEMCGGGGGGGGGGPAAGNDRTNPGGGGGGGAVLYVGLVEVTAGEDLEVTLGGGGAGGAAGDDGANGGDTTIVRVIGSVTLATALGAEGGSEGGNHNAISAFSTPINGDESETAIYTFAGGGGPCRTTSTTLAGGSGAGDWSIDKYCLFSRTPQQGGRGTSGNLSASRRGNGSPQGYLGGTGGGNGSNDTGYIGGGGGGGGGAGPFGAGGAAGSGGNANDAGSATNGTAGTSASANTGAGGGGGGASGASSTLTGSGGAGGNGGTGKAVLTFLRIP